MQNFGDLFVAHPLYFSVQKMLRESSVSQSCLIHSKSLPVALHDLLVLTSIINLERIRCETVQCGYRNIIACGLLDARIMRLIQEDDQKLLCGLRRIIALTYLTPVLSSLTCYSQKSNTALNRARGHWTCCISEWMVAS